MAKSDTSTFHCKKRIAVPSRLHGMYWLLAVAVTLLLTMLLTEPIPQDPAYHEFADARDVFGVLNF